ncbi:CHAT domain-containing protein [Streptomyces sp. NPDC096012]|uniref:CHAT domain-containing protein n=1 Tax=Streptomyces sp. NPDC096012 TaxID=3155684 RepID=UPI00336A3885
MSEDHAYRWEPRCPEEAQLRDLRASEFWRLPELEEEARRIWEELLHQEDLDAAGFLMRYLDVLAEYAGAMAVQERYLSARRDGLRDAVARPVPGAALELDHRSPPPSTTAPDGPEPTSQRFLNVAVVWPLSRSTVPDDRVLAPGQVYELRVDVGALAADSLLAPQATPFPDGLLDHSDDGGRGDWLEVTVLSDDFTVGSRRHAVFLPRVGNSWVCPCDPADRHTCEWVHRGRHLYIPFTTPDEQGPARLRMFVSHRGNQVQTATLTARVGAREGSGGFTTAAVDYTLTAGFAELGDLPERTAAICVGRGPHEMMSVDVHGQGAVTTFWLSEHQVLGALRRARDALLGLHVVRTGKAVLNRLDGNNGKPTGELLDDLATLALLGWDLFLLLARSRPEREALRRVLSRPAEIQVCRQELQNLVYPWGLLYDIPLDSQERPRPCRAGWAEVQRDPMARSCPAEDGHTLNSLCPFGFWGFRHFIEQPPSVRPGKRLRLWAGRRGEAPALTVGRSHSLDRPLMDRHLTALRGHFGHGGVLECDRRDTLRKALTDTAGACVYFYGHGRRPDPATEAPGTTVLEIGHGDRIAPRDLAAWADDCAWERLESAAPLVFLNGCHTVDSDPASWLTLVEAFSGFSASGVVGTEISVDQELANEIGERFWALLLAGEAVGPALHRVRMALLRKGNALGLAYTAYCSAALRLRAAP